MSLHCLTYLLQNLFVKILEWIAGQIGELLFPPLDEARFKRSIEVRKKYLKAKENARQVFVYFHLC